MYFFLLFKQFLSTVTQQFSCRVPVRSEPRAGWGDGDGERLKEEHGVSMNSVEAGRRFRMEERNDRAGGMALLLAVETAAC